MLQTLNIDPRHEVFWLTKANTCYRYGVFGTAWIGRRTERDVIDFVVEKMFVNATVESYVTLIQRLRRRILNVDQILNASRSMVGDGGSRVVLLEELSVEEQVSDDC